MKHRKNTNGGDPLIGGNDENIRSNPQGPAYHVPHYGAPAYYDVAYGGDPAGGDDEGIDLLKLVRILLRRWLTVLIFLVLGVLGGLLYVQKATPIYQAVAELEMSVRRPKVVNSQAVYDDASFDRDTDSIINTRFAKFRSPAMERMATEEYRKRFPEEERSSRELAFHVRNVSWTKDKRANIVRVATQSPDPLFAAQLVNVLTYCSGALMIQENQALSDGAVQWLNAQVEDQRASLDAVEKQLADLRKKVQLDSLSQRKTALAEALNVLSAEKSTLMNRCEARKTTYNFVVELANEKMDFEKLPTGLPKETELAALVAEWRSVKNALDKSADLYTDQHPEYQRLAKEELRARERIQQFVELSAVAVQNEIRLLDRQLEQLNRRVKTMEEQAIALEQQLVGGEQQLQSLERRRDAADDAYRAILQRMEQARLSADENTAFINVIRDAAVPENPIRPRKLQVLAVGLFIGLAIGCGMAFLLEFWTDKIMLVGDLKDMGLNILGTIPTQKDVASRGELATIGLKDKFSHVFEIYAGVNTLISSAKYRDHSQVLLVCSVMPGEGKTISACNLAIGAALNGRRTLLIDGDLRRPRMATIFGVGEEHPSLLEWLSSEDESLDFAHLVSSNIQKNLDLVTSRPSRDTNPAELMGRKHLGDLIAWARQHYDRIVIDSPPLGLVGDTQALADQADAVIIVSRLGVTRKRALRFALGRLAELDSFVVGCIANDVPHSLAGLFSGGHDGYGYGTSYKSYGRDDDKA